jgi:hypothetical protein
MSALRIKTRNQVFLLGGKNSDRIVLTHDRATMPDFAYHRILNGEKMSGLFVINDRMPIRQAIDDLLIIVSCSQPAEWQGIVLYLPL